MNPTDLPTAKRALDASGPPHILAITGGKGGVGKTSVAVNLAIALARLKKRVCLLDGDTGLANVNILLGLHPQYSLEHLISGERNLQQILLDGPQGLKIIPGATGVSRCAEMNSADQMRLLQGLREVESHFDWLLVDTAAGISSLTTRMIDAAQMAAIVITPEPTSLTDAFSLLKVLHRNGYQRRVLVIVNMVSSTEQPQTIFRRFQAAVQKYIGLDSQYLGNVWMDESMRVAVASQKPVATLPVSDPSCRLFIRLADSLTSVFDNAEIERRSMSDYWLEKLPQKPAEQPIFASEDLGTTDLQQTPNEDVYTGIHTLLGRFAGSTIPHDQAYELLHAILERVDATRFSDQQVAELTNLIDNRMHAAVDDQSDMAIPEEEPPQRLPAEQSGDLQVQPANIYGHGGYDESRFGSQQQLAREIKMLDDNTSLDDFLSQLKNSAKSPH